MRDKSISTDEKAPLNQVGFAQADITPPVGIKLAGLGGRPGPSEGVYHPLRAVCVAIGEGEDAVVIVSVEWVACYKRSVALRQRISRLTGVRTSNIVLNATHTHCGPEINGTEPLVEDYHRGVVDAVGRCAQDAFEGQMPARLRVTRGYCDIAVSRRRPDGEGGICVPMRPAPDAPHDHEVPVVCAESVDGSVVGVLFNYACHPTGRGGYDFGGDYVAFACDRIESAHPGAIACFLQGCAGDQKLDTGHPDRFPYLELDALEGKGRQLGDSVLHALAETSSSAVSGPISLRSNMLKLEMENVSRATLEKFQGSEEAGLRAWANYFINAEAEHRDPRDCSLMELQVLSFGRSLAIICMAAEPTVEHGLRMKRELGQAYSCVIPVGCCNDLIGYVPVRRQIAEAGYEVWRSNQLKLLSGPYVADTEDRLHGAVHQLLGAEG